MSNTAFRGSRACWSAVKEEPMTRTHAWKANLILLSILLAFGVGAPAAEAGPLVASATNCSPADLERPFLRWADPSSYTLVPGGSFEAEAPGWKLSRASVVAGNEPFYAHRAGESHSLSIAAGGSATTPTLCVGLDKPTLRFFAQGNGLTAVSVSFETSLGLVLSAPIGVVTPGPWAPTLPMPVLVNLLPLLPGDQTPVQFKFTPALGASLQIDDVYVDPRRH
jgi:hypothetical protein